MQRFRKAQTGGSNPSCGLQKSGLLQNRIYFSNADDRESFFNAAKNSEQIINWNRLARRLGIKRGKLWYYRTGKLTLAEKTFENILSLLPAAGRAKVLKKVSIMQENWGAVKGGFATLRKHPEILAKGRKALRKRASIKYDFDLNKPLNDEIAEIVGAFIGDGFTNKYWIKREQRFKYQTSFSGDYRFDFEYYEKVIIPFIKRNLNENMKAQVKRIKQSNGMQIDFHSKRLFEFLTSRLKLPAGLKFDKVLIPEEIRTSEKLVKKCLRGIFDTDGCLFFDKRKAYKEPYIRISLKLTNPPIIEQIFSELQNLNVSCKKLNTRKEIQIMGKKNVLKFIKTIGFSNPRHLKKIPAGLLN